MAVIRGYEEKHGFVRCPLCGEYAHNVVYETFEGKWTYCPCGVELCHDGFVGAGKHRCDPLISSHSGNISTEKDATMTRFLTL